MARKPRKESRRRPVRSAAQREWNVAWGLASKLWDNLSESQRLAWNARAKARRMSGQRYCTAINAPRYRDRQSPLLEPPAPPIYDGRPILKRLLIRNRGGRISLQVELSHIPSVRVTVWGSRPYNAGVSAGIRCPRLGELPARKGMVRDITVIYFQKHGEHIVERRMTLVGKRIFIRLRVELEGWGNLYEAASALVPPPEGRRWRPKKR